MGKASILLDSRTLLYLAVERPEIDILEHIDFGDGLWQTLVSHPKLPEGYNGQTELYFEPWPHGDIHFRRETDT